MVLVSGVGNVGNVGISVVGNGAGPTLGAVVGAVVGSNYYNDIF